MKPSDISVVCVLADKRMISFIQDEPGNLSVLVTYKHRALNNIAPENIRVQLESADKQDALLFSKIDQFGRKAILEALSNAIAKQPTLDSRCSVYFEVENGEPILIENGSVDKVHNIKSLNIIFKKTDDSDHLNRYYGLFPKGGLRV